MGFQKYIIISRVTLLTPSIPSFIRFLMILYSGAVSYSCFILVGLTSAGAVFTDSSSSMVAKLSV